MSSIHREITIVMPAKNEARSLEILLPQIKDMYPHISVLVINDGSTDDTEAVCKENKTPYITHPYSKGNGASIKTGASAVTTPFILFMDADSQHKPENITAIIERYFSDNLHMAIGARSKESQASLGRWAANELYNRLASWITENKVEDLTSGFRMVNREKFLEFFHLYPNGFSYPTTSTMAFYRQGYSVGFEPITTNPRIGKSHIRLRKDGIRFLLIIFKIATLYSPMKLFMPTSLTMLLIGSSYGVTTLVSQGTFTNMSALFITTGIMVFLMGLISEQIASMQYKKQS